MIHQLPFSSLPHPHSIQSSFPRSFKKSQLGSAPKYVYDHIRPPISASSLHRLRSSQRHDLFMPCVRTTMAHTRSFAFIVPSLGNNLPPPFSSFILVAPLSTSLSHLKSYLFPGTEMH